MKNKKGAIPVIGGIFLIVIIVLILLGLGGWRPPGSIVEGWQANWQCSDAANGAVCTFSRNYNCGGGMAMSLRVPDTISQYPPENYIYTLNGDEVGIEAHAFILIPACSIEEQGGNAIKHVSGTVAISSKVAPPLMTCQDFGYYDAIVPEMDCNLIEVNGLMCYSCKAPAPTPPLMTCQDFGYYDAIVPEMDCNLIEANGLLSGISMRCYNCKAPAPANIFEIIINQITDIINSILSSLRLA